MQGGNMPVTDRFFPSGVGRNPLDGEVNFDEAFGIISFVTHLLASKIFSAST
jgi:hypothetical protein